METVYCCVYCKWPADNVDSEDIVYSHCEQTVWSSWTNRGSDVKLRELPVAVAGLTTMWSRSPSVRLTRVSGRHATPD